MEIKEGPIERKTKVLQRNAHNTHIRQEHVTKRMIWVGYHPRQIMEMKPTLSHLMVSQRTKHPKKKKKKH
jgi:hypothetical protein